MTDSTPGYQALRESAAWLDLTGRGHIRVTGEDRKRLLHAMTTNQIQGLEPGAWRYAFFLNSQGRMLADVNVLCTESELLLDVEPESRVFVLDHLDKFIIADDVELTDLTDEVAVIDVEGPDAERVVASLGLIGLKSWPVSATGTPGMRIVVPQTGKAALLTTLTAAGVVEATPEDAEAVRLEHARPRYGTDLTAAHIPNEARLAGAVHLSKGCYLGQEIVERVRSRGKANRLLTHFEIDGNARVLPGAKLMAEEKDIGEITSAAYSPAEQKWLALGYVRSEFADPGKQVNVESAGIATATNRLIEKRAA